MRKVAQRELGNEVQAQERWLGKVYQMRDGRDSTAGKDAAVVTV